MVKLNSELPKIDDNTKKPTKIILKDGNENECPFCKKELSFVQGSAECECGHWRIGKIQQGGWGNGELMPSKEAFLTKKADPPAL